MCGIVGYVGPRAALGVVLEGLRRMEYRGYDSAGIAIVQAGRLHVRKKAGKIANLDAELVSHPLPGDGLGIGHTRWATHGGPTDVNAHPHVSADGRVAVVHNGIIENFAALRLELEARGIEMTSDTDTEVVAHLVDDAYGQVPADHPTRLREAGGGLPGVRAIGLLLSDGRAQVSTNVHDPIAVPLGAVVERIEELARPAGARPLEAELVGLIPEAALAGYPDEVPIRGFEPDRRVIERLLPSSR